MPEIARNYFLQEILKRGLTSPAPVISLAERSLQNGGVKVRLTYFDFRCFNEALSHPEYLQALERFSFYVDSAGMRKGYSFLFNKKPEIFNGTDLNFAIVRKLIAEKRKVFFVGGNFNPETIFRKAQEKGLNLIGYLNGFEDVKDREKASAFILSKKPDAVIVGMGAPRQEIFVSRFLADSDVPLILCVGNFMAFFLGFVKRAPDFLRNSGFEWAFRLLVEPKKLWKRYLFGIPVFIFRIIKLKIQTNKKTQVAPE